MKRTKLNLIIVVLVLCVSVLGIGIFAATPIGNPITGTVTVTASNAEVTIQAFLGDSSGTPITSSASTRTSMSLAFNQRLVFLTHEGESLINAENIDDVDDLLITFVISTSSTKPLGVYFSSDKAITQELKNIENGVEKISSGSLYNGLLYEIKEEQRDLVSSTVDGYSKLYPNSSVEMTMTLHLNRLILDEIDILINDLCIYVEPFNVDMLTDSADNYIVAIKDTNYYYARTANYTDGTYSGWAGAIGNPKSIKHIEFRVGAREEPITQIAVILTENDTNGTVVASDTLNVNIAPNTYGDVVWTLETPISNTGTPRKNYCFGFSCDQECNLYKSGSKKGGFTSGNLYYCTGGVLRTDFTSGWTEGDAGFMAVIFGEEKVQVETYRELEFHEVGSSYEGTQTNQYATGNFSGWAGSIGNPEIVRSIKFNFYAREDITKIRLYLYSLNNKQLNTLLAAACYRVDFEQGSYHEFVWNLDTPIEDNSNYLYFGYSCDNLCSVYLAEGDAIDTDYEKKLSYGTFGSNEPITQFTDISGNTGYSMAHLAVNFGYCTVPIIEDEEETSSTSNRYVDVRLASSYDVVVGDKFQLYYRGILKVVNPYNYYIKVICNKGKAYPRYYQFEPVAEDVGEYSFAVQVYDDNAILLGEGETTLKVIDPMKNTTYATAKNILCIGDSLTAPGKWVKEGYRRFCMSGGTPAGLGNTDSLNFIGTKSEIVDGKTIRWEGTGGWSWLTYCSSMSPFYNPSTSQIDFEYYCTENGFSGIDEVYFLLTWNGHGTLYPSSYPKDSGNLYYAQLLIDKLKTQYPSVKVTCLGIPLNSLGGGMGSNYDLTLSYGDSYGMFLTAYNYNKALEEICLSEKYSGFVRYVDTKAQFDSEYNYPYTNVNVNPRNDTTEVRQTNGVHPSDNGYLQIGDVFYRALCSRYTAE